MNFLIYNGIFVVIFDEWKKLIFNLEFFDNCEGYNFMFVNVMVKIVCKMFVLKLFKFLNVERKLVE